MEEILIAQCGLNCNACSAYLAWKNDVRSKGYSSANCKGCCPQGKGCRFEKACKLPINQRRDVRFCYDCEKFNCKPEDNYYEEKYNVSPYGNLVYIKENGIKKFLKNEEKKWKCPECGGVISWDKGICFSCGLDKLKKKKIKIK